MVDLRSSSPIGDSSSSDEETFEMIDGSNGRSIQSSEVKDNLEDDVQQPIGNEEDAIVMSHDKERDVGQLEENATDVKEDTFACSLCPDWPHVVGEDAIREHWNTHHKDEPLTYNCDDCGGKLPTMDEFLTHDCKEPDVIEEETEATNWKSHVKTAFLLLGFLLLAYNAASIHQYNTRQAASDRIQDELALIRKTLEYSFQFHDLEMTAKINEIGTLKSAIEQFKMTNELLSDEISNLRAADLERKSQIRTVTFSPGSNGKYGVDRMRSTITDVVPGSPADLNGLKRGDQIVSVNGIKVDSLPKQVLDDIYASLAGPTTFELTHNAEGLLVEEPYWNYTKMLDKQITERESEIEQLKEAREESNGNIEALAAENEQLKNEIEEMKKQNDEKFNSQAPHLQTRTVTLVVKEGSNGLKYIGTSIVEVEKQAFAKGLRRGDQMISINGINVETVEHKKMGDIFKATRSSGIQKMVVRFNPARLRDVETKWDLSNVKK